MLPVYCPPLISDCSCHLHIMPLQQQMKVWQPRPPSLPHGVATFFCFMRDLRLRFYRFFVSLANRSGRAENGNIQCGNLSESCGYPEISSLDGLDGNTLV